MAGNSCLFVRDICDGSFEFSCSQEEFDSRWRQYFDLDRDYGACRRAVPAADEFLTAAVHSGRGIRILKQDPWEMLITFIISQRKNIPAIRAAVELLCGRYGLPVDGALGKNGFPTAEALCSVSMDELKACSLGYRAPYIYKAARMAADGTLNLKAMEALKDEELLEKLMTVPGVGPKVANCVALFGYHRLSSFPIDVWIARMIDRYYDGCFPFELYDGFGGIIQQYIFYYMRKEENR